MTGLLAALRLQPTPAMRAMQATQAKQLTQAKRPSQVNQPSQAKQPSQVSPAAGPIANEDDLDGPQRTKPVAKVEPAGAAATEPAAAPPAKPVPVSVKVTTPGDTTVSMKREGNKRTLAIQNDMKKLDFFKKTFMVGPVPCYTKAYGKITVGGEVSRENDTRGGKLFLKVTGGVRARRRRERRRHHCRAVRRRRAKRSGFAVGDLRRLDSYRRGVPDGDLRGRQGRRQDRDRQGAEDRRRGGARELAVVRRHVRELQGRRVQRPEGSPKAGIWRAPSRRCNASAPPSPMRSTSTRRRRSRKRPRTAPSGSPRARLPARSPTTRGDVLDKVKEKTGVDIGGGAEKVVQFLVDPDGETSSEAKARFTREAEAANEAHADFRAAMQASGLDGELQRRGRRRKSTNTTRSSTPRMRVATGSR